MTQTHPLAAGNGISWTGKKAVVVEQFTILIDGQGIDDGGGDVDIVADNDHTNAGALIIAAAQRVACNEVVESISLR